MQTEKFVKPKTHEMSNILCNVHTPKALGQKKYNAMGSFRTSTFI